MEQPWLHEPDFAKWRDPETGLICAIVRPTLTKALCGYVKIPNCRLRQKLIRYRQNDPGTFADSIFHRRYRRNGYSHSLLKGIDVHGGLTFSGSFRDYRLSGYWIGFDCAHAFDFIPKVHETLVSLGKEYARFQLSDIYRDFTYVKKETTSLARQVAKIIADN